MFLSASKAPCGRLHYHMLVENISIHNNVTGLVISDTRSVFVITFIPFAYFIINCSKSFVLMILLWNINVNKHSKMDKKLDLMSLLEVNILIYLRLSQWHNCVLLFCILDDKFYSIYLYQDTLLYKYVILNLCVNKFKARHPTLLKHSLAVTFLFTL